MYSREFQAETVQVVMMEIGRAVEGKIVNNETLGYCMARTFLFLERCGINP
jgi:glycyl-tRNA synthetase